MILDEPENSSSKKRLADRVLPSTHRADHNRSQEEVHVTSDDSANVPSSSYVTETSVQPPEEMKHQAFQSSPAGFSTLGGGPQGAVGSSPNERELNVSNNDSSVLQLTYQSVMSCVDAASLQEGRVSLA